MNQKQFANINNFQCLEKRRRDGGRGGWWWWRDAERAEKSRSALHLSGRAWCFLSWLSTSRSLEEQEKQSRKQL